MPFEFILIQFFKTCLLVKTSFYLFQMPVFYTVLNTRIWWGAYNQAVPPGITRPICMHDPGCYDYRYDF